MDSRTFRREIRPIQKSQASIGKQQQIWAVKNWGEIRKLLTFLSMYKSMCLTIFTTVLFLVRFLIFCDNLDLEKKLILLLEVMCLVGWSILDFLCCILFCLVLFLMGSSNFFDFKFFLFVPWLSLVIGLIDFDTALIHSYSLQFLFYREEEIGCLAAFKID